MHSKRQHILLSIEAAAEPVLSVPVMVSPGKMITLQFLCSLTAAEATIVTLLQSTDGLHFDIVSDASGDPLTLPLDPSDNSATLNIINLLTQWLRFHIEFPEGETGAVHSVNLITA